jgi:TRAP-type C4-dicarboxylate transport system permease small subunit
MSAPKGRPGRLSAGIDGLIRLSLYGGMGWVMVMMFITTLDVSGRAFFSRPITGAIELNRCMLAVFSVMGLAYTHHERANVRVTMLLDLLPPAPRAFLEILSHLICIGLVGLLCWQSGVMGVEEIHAGTTTDALSIPIFPLYFLLSAGSFFLCLEMARQLLADVKAFSASFRRCGEARER